MDDVQKQRYHKAARMGHYQGNHTKIIFVIQRNKKADESLNNRTKIRKKATVVNDLNMYRWPNLRSQHIRNLIYTSREKMTLLSTYLKQISHTKRIHVSITIFSHPYKLHYHFKRFLSILQVQNDTFEKKINMHRFKIRSSRVENKFLYFAKHMPKLANLKMLIPHMMSKTFFSKNTYTRSSAI